MNMAGIPMIKKEFQASHLSINDLVSNHHESNHFEIKPLPSQQMLITHPIEELDQKILDINNWPDNYIILLAHTCPRGQRLLIVLDALNLLGKIPIVTLSSVKNDHGDWQFKEPDAKQFAINNAESPLTLRMLTGSNVQPVIYNRLTQQIVCDDHYSLPSYFINLYDYNHKDFVSTTSKVHRWNHYLYFAINKLIYQVAQQKDSNIKKTLTYELNDHFAQLNQYLGQSSYLLGDDHCESDTRLWVNLIRYQIYRHQFKIQLTDIDSYPHLIRYAKQLMSRPSYQHQTEFESIIETHYQSGDNVARYQQPVPDRATEQLFGWLIE